MLPPQAKDAPTVPLGLVRETLLLVAQPLDADLHGVGQMVGDGFVLELTAAGAQSANWDAAPHVEQCPVGPAPTARVAHLASHVEGSNPGCSDRDTGDL